MYQQDIEPHSHWYLGAEDKADNVTQELATLFLKLPALVWVTSSHLHLPLFCSCASRNPDFSPTAVLPPSLRALPSVILLHLLCPLGPGPALSLS